MAWLFLLLAWTRIDGSAKLAMGADASRLPGQGVRAADLNVARTGKVGFTLLPPEKTGIAFTNTLSDWASAENRVLNNGSGVAAGDFDNDGRVDLFLSSLNNRNALFRNLGGWRFEDVTSKAGLQFKPGFYRGAVFADVNGDGWLDLFIGTASEGVLCFLNDGHGKFTDRTAEAGTRSGYGSSTTTLADIDGNGTLDLYVSNTRQDDIRDAVRVPVMFVNGKPTVPPPLRDRLVFDNQLLLEFGDPDVLYLNDGQGRFTAVSWTDGRFLTEQGQPLTQGPLDWGLTAAFRDLNDDGEPDLYVCNDFWTPDRFWINSGNGRFRLAPQFALRKTSFSSMGIAFADINRDGLMDFFVPDMLSRSGERRKQQDLAQRATPARIGDISRRSQVARNTLFLNRGDGTFAEIAHLAGVFASEWSWSPVFLDVDLDGYEDLLITTGHLRDIQDLDATRQIQALQSSWKRPADLAALQRSFVEAKREHMKLYPFLSTPVVAYRNLGNLRFEDLTQAWGLDHPSVQHGIALADFDNDGDLDFVVNRLGSAAGVFRNEAGAPRIAVRLRGEAPNTQALGAKVELAGGAVRNQKQEVAAGGSYLSGSDTMLVFAPGAAQRGMTLRIAWRSGKRSVLEHVTSNRIYEIDEAGAPGAPGVRTSERESVEAAEQRRARTSTNDPSRITDHSSRFTFPRSHAPALFEDVSDWLRHTHHEEPFSDLERQPLLPRQLSQSGPGVAWFDVNQDGWEDLIVGAGKGGQLAVLLNQKGQAFSQLNTAPLGVMAPRDLTAPIGWRNGAGHSTVLVGSAAYENGDTNASCVLSYDMTSGKIEASFPGHTASVGALAMADADGDGDLDLFVGGQGIPGKYPVAAGSLVFKHEQGQWVQDPIASRALSEAGLVNGAVWSDLDQDGLPELILACEWGPVRVFTNRSGNLREVTRELGLAEFTGLWTGVTTGDLDQDGRLEIIAGNWGWNTPYRASAQIPLRVYYGNIGGQGIMDVLEAEIDPVLGRHAPRPRRETLVAALPFVAERFPTFSAYSHAGIAEILRDRPGQVPQREITTLASTVFFNRNGRFEARELPVEAQFAPVWAVNVADMDGDGNEDVFLSQNFFAFPTEEARLEAGRALWLRGDGQGNLAAVPGQLSGVIVYGDQRGAALADFDKDGRVDLVVTQNAGETKLFKNGKARPGLRVRLAGRSGNPDGIGAVIRVKYGDGLGPARELHAGSGYWSQDSVVPVLGTRGTPSAVWVRWPRGRITKIPVPEGRTEIILREE